MKNELKLLYGIDDVEISKEQDVFTFSLNEQLFYFVPCKRNPKELIGLNQLGFELLSLKYPSSIIIENLNGQLCSIISEENYVLLKINTLPEQKLFDFPFFSLSLNASIGNRYQNDWDTLWSNKIDYYEYQISQIGKGKEVVINSLSYYLGMAENAISYANQTNQELSFSNDDLAVCHRRLYYPSYALNYYNPLSYIIDLKVRDIAEYIKSAFYNGEDEILNFCKDFINNNILSPYALRMFYARLLFPTYYFDCYEQIINFSVPEEQLIPIIEKNQKWELFLQEIYYFINKKQPIPAIDWLLINKGEH